MPESVMVRLRHTRRFGALIGLSLLVLTGCAPRVAPPQESGEAPARPTERLQSRVSIWDGVYTNEQAALGERTAYVNCFSCHTAAEWGSARFLNPSTGQRLGELFQTISRSMPMDDPGRLTPAQYAAVIAFMLKLQGAPAGERELPSDVGELDRIFVAPPERGW